MTETCSICGRAKLPPCPHLAVEAGSMRCLDCGYVLRGGEPTFPKTKAPANPCRADLACYRLGCEREKARADAALAVLAEWGCDCDPGPGGVCCDHETTCEEAGHDPCLAHLLERALLGRAHVGPTVAPSTEKTEPTSGLEPETC